MKCKASGPHDTSQAQVTPQHVPLSATRTRGRRPARVRAPPLGPPLRPLPRGRTHHQERAPREVGDRVPAGNKHGLDDCYSGKSLRPEMRTGGARGPTRPSARGSSRPTARGPEVPVPPPAEAAWDRACVEARWQGRRRREPAGTARRRRAGPTGGRWPR